MSTSCLSALAAALDCHNAERNLAQNRGTVGSVAEFDDQLAKDRALSAHTFLPPSAAAPAAQTPIAVALDSQSAERNLAQNQGTVGSVAEFDDQLAKDRALSAHTFLPPSAVAAASPCSHPECSVHKNATLRTSNGTLRDDAGAANVTIRDVILAVVCEHCGGAVSQVSLHVVSMDGVTLDVTVPQWGLVRDIKRFVGQVSGGDSLAGSCAEGVAGD